jgi:hypothetical protein
MSASAASRWLLRLSLVDIPLLAAAALAGVAWPGLYRDAPSLVPQLVGQDWVTLLVAVPALAAATVAVRRGRRLGVLAALGVHGYAAYSYALYAFGVRHNPLFLVYVAILGTSVWALVAGFAALDLRDRAGAAAARLDWRWIGGLFVTLAIAFAALWLADVVGALARAETPASVQLWQTPTNGVHVLDLAFVLPILAWTGARMWRRQPGAVAVAGVLLFKLVTLGLALLAMGAVSLRRDQPVDPGLASMFALMTVLSMVTVVRYVRALWPRAAREGAASFTVPAPLARHPAP